MRRFIASLVLLPLPMLIGCGAPSDPVKNLDWHISKVIKTQANADGEINQVKDTEGVDLVLQLAEPEAYHGMLRARIDARKKMMGAEMARREEMNRRREEDALKKHQEHTVVPKANHDEEEGAIIERTVVPKANHDAYGRMPNNDIATALLQKKQVWYKVKYAIGSEYKRDVRKTDSLTTPLTADVMLSCQVSCSNLFTTKEAAAIAPLKSRTGDFTLVFGYQDGKWKLLSGQTGQMWASARESLFKLFSTMNE